MPASETTSSALQDTISKPSDTCGMLLLDNYVNLISERDEDVGHHHAFWVAPGAEAAHLARHLGFDQCDATKRR